MVRTSDCRSDDTSSILVRTAMYCPISIKVMHPVYIRTKAERYRHWVPKLLPSGGTMTADAS